MDARFAAWTAPRSDLEAAYEEVEPYRHLPPAERVSVAARLSTMALAFLERFSLHERRRILAATDDMAPQHEQAWLALVAKARGR
ncbi:MAG: hypothetical protein HYY06_11735 [Deltaproteobacteria bacterium]|nr:hypothetical protein [Deltaproteobacteria bacterium]